ncbi:DUF2157 domain-containing protein [Aliihoeflea sp. PC F10.4]
MFPQRRIVQREIDHWEKRGLIDRAIGDRLRADISSRHVGGVRVVETLVVMSAVLFAAAILIFVAANWDAIPRIVRCALLAATILAANTGGAWQKARGNKHVAEGLWIVGAAAFGASIALVGQMYHLSGDAAGAFLTWYIATAVSAVAFSSRALTVACVGLSVAWAIAYWGQTYAIFTSYHNANHFYPLLLAGAYAISFRTGSALARHAAMVALALYFAMLFDDWGVWFAAGLLIVTTALFAAAIRMPDPFERMLRLGGRLPIHLLLYAMLAATMLHSEWYEGVELAILAAFLLVMLVGVLLMGGRESRAIRGLVYTAFAAELSFVYIRMIGTMLSTAGFLLIAALAFAIFAFAVSRFERRLAGEAAS